ncbi:MAG: antitermination regulator [Glaciihabitans sp.]|nr:antitermination regulator [Glaciihabitans sp.]
MGSPVSHTTDDHNADSGSASALGEAFLQLMPITGVSISVFNQALKQSTIYASDDTAARLDELQFDLGEGPAFDSVRSTAPVLLGDIAAEAQERWPIFTQSLSALPVGALFTFPLVMGAVCIGVATLYSTTPGNLSDDTTATGRSVARSIAGPALRRAARSAHSDEPLGMGQPVIELRREVHQATGMVVGQLNISATEAFARLRAHAFSTDRTVQQVAHEVLSRDLNFSQLSDG